MRTRSLPFPFARVVAGLLTAVTLATAVPADATPPVQLVITEAVANEEDGLLTIVGRNFGDTVPTVTLGGPELVVVESDAVEIIAELPPLLPPGTYRLVVSRGPGPVATDDFALVLGLGDGDAEDEITAVIAGEGLTGGGDTGEVELGLDFAALDDAYARLDAPNSFQFEQTAPTFNGDTVQAGVVFAGEMTASNADGTASYGETSADGASGVAGFSNAPAFGIGVSGSIDSASGYALYGSSFVPTGDVRAVFAEVFSPEGTAGYFVNGANGTILSGHAENEALVFRVTGDGTVQGNAFTDLAGNPIGADGVGVFQVDTGAGLAGGPITGSGVIEVDFGTLDGQYARLDAGNQFLLDQRAPSFIAERSDEAPAIQGRNFAGGFGIGVLGEAFGTEGMALYGRAYSETGQTTGVHGIVHSPDGTAGLFESVAGGRVLVGTSDLGEVFTVDGAGAITASRLDVNDFATDGKTISAVSGGENGTSVWGSNDSPGFGIGVHGRTSSSEGFGVWAETTSGSGFARALHAVANSPDGVAAVFQNNAGGQILSAGSAGGGEVLRLEQDGTLRAAAFTDLAGNPIGADGVGVFQVDTGAGLAGGPITGSGVIEVDFGNLDSRYPRIDQENFYGATQYFADVAVGGWLDAASIHAQNDEPTSYVIDGLSLAGSGQTRAINGTTLSPDSIAVAGHVAAPGPGGGAGVLGSTESDDGFGVGGFATSTAGYAVGVYGETYGENTIGVRGSVLTGGGVGGVGVSGASDGDAGIGVLGTSDHPTGTAGVLRGQGGQLLRAETFGGEVFSVAGNGDVNAAGTVFANAVVETSARRFKTNVRPLVDPLTTVGRLRGVAFDWKDDGRADIGLIAEEVAEVLPEIVGVEADGAARGVNYGRLTALLLEAVKAQQATIESLQSQVLMLEASLDR